MAGRLSVRRVVGRQLLHRAGCLLAPGHHSRHELYPKSRGGVLWLLPDVHRVRRGHLPVRHDAVAAVYPGHLVSAGHGHCRSAHDSAECRLERMGPRLLVHGRTLQRAAARGFVILGWAGLFSGGIAAQIVTRYSNLTDVVWNSQSKAILNNRIVP